MGGMHSPATIEQIIILNKNFIDNPILSPIYCSEINERKQA